MTTDIQKKKEYAPGTMPRAYPLVPIQIGKLVPLISAAIDNADNLNLLSFLIYPEVDQVIFDRELMYALTMPGFFFGKRHSIGKLSQRSNFLFQSIKV